MKKVFRGGGPATAGSSEARTVNCPLDLASLVTRQEQCGGGRGAGRRLTEEIQKRIKWEGSETEGLNNCLEEICCEEE